MTNPIATMTPTITVDTLTLNSEGINPDMVLGHDLAVSITAISKAGEKVAAGIRSACDLFALRGIPSEVIGKSPQKLTPAERAAPVALKAYSVTPRATNANPEPVPVEYPAVTATRETVFTMAKLQVILGFPADERKLLALPTKSLDAEQKVEKRRIQQKANPKLRDYSRVLARLEGEAAQAEEDKLAEEEKREPVNLNAKSEKPPEVKILEMLVNLKKRVSEYEGKAFNQVTVGALINDTLTALVKDSKELADQVEDDGEPK